MLKVTTPHFSSRRGKKPLMVIVHGTGSLNEQGTVSWIADPASKVSYHYMVGRSGQIVQFVEEGEKAWHAGKSHWGELGFPHTSVNAWSIGVSFTHDGGEHPYQPIQYKEGAVLIADIIRRHNIPLHMIRGHNEVAPNRKTDPYEVWDWRKFYGLLGLAASGRIRSVGGTD